MTDHDLNDELNPQHELASTYLDGVASPAERAQVEASLELLTLVASFTAVRAQLADIPPVAAATREGAFAAAFAEFDEPAPTPAAAGAAIIPLNTKRRWARPVLSVAAAVLLVGAIGVAAKGGLSGDDKSSNASMETSAKVASADATTEARLSSDTMTASTIGYIGGGAEAALIIDTPEQLQALAMTALADNALATAGLPETTAATSENTASADTLAPSTPGEFTSYTREALRCLTAEQEFLADILYQGTFAIAARDTVTGMIFAIADDCTVLAAVGP